MKQILSFLLLLLALAPAGLTGQEVDSGLTGQEAESDLRLMTFNIRYGTAEDGSNAWSNRRALVADIIAEASPDVLAIQEGLDFQLAELEPVLAGYRKLGQHREGGTEGEFSGIYVKEDRVQIVDWGEFWLSPTPDARASVGWDAALPRMAVWADITFPGGTETVRVYGTHFDHRGEEARLESARLIARHAKDAPTAIVMGDLNADEESEPLKAFLEAGYRSAYPTLHPTADLGTFNGFRDATGGRRIDHVLLGPGLEPKAAEIIDHQVDGVWPSDHFPVTAVISLAQGPLGG